MYVCVYIYIYIYIRAPQVLQAAVQLLAERELLDAAVHGLVHSRAQLRRAHPVARIM